MATRSFVIVEMSNGAWGRIYVHNDGDPEDRIPILKYYTTQEKCEGLIRLGPLSIMDRSIRRPTGHTFATPVKGYCVSYRRDKDAPNSRHDGFNLLEDAIRNLKEYIYVWKNGCWWWSDYQGIESNGVHSLKECFPASGAVESIKAPKLVEVTDSIGVIDPIYAGHALYGLF